MATLAVSLLAFAIPAHTATAQSQDPPCVISDDSRYAYSHEQPVQVGGGPRYGAARQRRYLDSLLGPAGQVIRHKRLGSRMTSDDTVLDHYEVTYDGLEQPVSLYLDWYHFTEARAPKGFSCGRSLDLGLPPPDPFMAGDQLNALAIARGTDKTVDLGPIEVGQPVAARVFDHFRLLMRSARSAAAGGSPLDASSLSRELKAPRTIILVAPQSCEDKTILPKEVTLRDPQGEEMRPAATYSQTGALTNLLPGISMAAGTLASVFSIETIRTGTLAITFDGPTCGASSHELTLPLAGASARLLDSPMPSRPAGSSVTNWIAVQAILDHAGAFRMPISLGGPADLAKIAIDAIGTWRAVPTQISGGPIATPVVLKVTFKAVQ